MQRIFYNKTTGLRIVDFTGKKTITQIKKEYGTGDYIQLDIDEKVDGHMFEGGVLKKYSLADSMAETIAREFAEKEQLEIRQQIKETKRETLRVKMKLTKDEFALLRGE